MRLLFLEGVHETWELFAFSWGFLYRVQVKRFYINFLVDKILQV